MADYLLLRLYGPLASWGEIAVGESRHSAVHPSRSALLGLLGAALGIERTDEAGQRALIEGYRFGIRLECTGSPMRDYHTVQVGVPPRKFRFRSRRQELSAAKVETILSAREYRCDSLALVAVEALPSAPVDLDALAQALREPSFSLYLGRKSCPLALPLLPRKVAAASVREALDTAEFPSLLGLLDQDAAQVWPSRQDRQYLRPGQIRYYWEDGMEAGMKASFDSWRHDQPLSRSRWQFAPRREWVALSGGEQG
ncbi:type I-E CRISPR-associated protein Cas5/CasD [Stutzerimonas balearica]|jgi:CRISPR system Cascade subunit CasD|uniref:CRISPR system Cascade subunit CasD n=1 Tax=Stutzerimonas balearica DSM 6083 TaxID=1123016 RepID=A0A8D3Y4L2_9GAMM|nr:MULTISPECIES: type I-E CRISPR-associated protein Cas5/CasD [Pseudomonadota]KIL03949.1 CRISPR-associated protein Cas5 [Stutzerimonas stutzeri]MBB59758.1 type I-E CRISPR-associated protein Cas5/CasD [Pseudomonas sp.]AJE16842.1 CRISPR-associated protein Cas5 [Stutzerimonas balearica DSM 6083]MCZ4129697.1 type I-E CRISPR-associated protein Cas5/CasD [Stutzerimonas balearica]MDI3491882.1 system Cascade subunit CasD [Thauera sp.]